jgi:histone H3/H4
MPTHRDDIGLATCKRLLAAGSGIADVRTAKEAAEQAQDAVKQMIHDAGTKAASLLRLKKTKTVDKDMIIACFEGTCTGISVSNLVSAPRKGKGQRGVPLAGVDRIFREKLSGDSRVTGEAAKALVGAAEAYLRSLGRNAGLMAKAARRNTIQGADIVSARQLRLN